MHTHTHTYIHAYIHISAGTNMYMYMQLLVRGITSNRYLILFTERKKKKTFSDVTKVE